MTSKLINNKRSAHAEKVLKSLSKKKSDHSVTVDRSEAFSAPSSTSMVSEIKHHYYVIRKDLMRLRDDLAKGYDMAKNFLDTKTLMKEFLKTK